MARLCHNKVKKENINVRTSVFGFYIFCSIFYFSMLYMLNLKKKYTIMNTNVIFRYITCKQKQKKILLSGLKNCHKIIYRKRFLYDNRNIVLTRNITKGGF